MNDNTKHVNLKCDNCLKYFERSKTDISKNANKKIKNTFCSGSCHDEFRRKKTYQEMCERVDADFKEWLIEKYYGEELATRKISELLYGKSNNGPNILKWMKKLGIPTRSRTDAVALQWKDNHKRRQEQRKFMANMWKNSPELREQIISIMQTDEYKQKQSVAKTGERNGMYGVTRENHPQWNPDLTEEERTIGRKYKEYYRWRKKVYERDNHTCQRCKDNTGGNLVAHHINSYHWDKNSRTDINNGITLCEDCHKEFHSMYGYKDNDMFQFSQFMNMRASV